MPYSLILWDEMAKMLNPSLLWNFFSDSTKHNGGELLPEYQWELEFFSRHYHLTVRGSYKKRIYLMINQRFVLLKPLLCILTFKGWSSMVASILTEGHLRVPPSDKKHCSWGMQSIMYAAAHFPLSISSLRNKQTNRIYWVEALVALYIIYKSFHS